LRVLFPIFLVFSTLIFASCSDSDEAAPSAASVGVFEAADNAFSSTAGLIDAQSSAASIRTSATCSAQGEPETAVGAAQYAGDRIFCQMNVNSKSPDTIQGSYYLASAVLCAIEKSYSFTYGATPVTEDNLSFAENDSCFGTDGFDANGDGDTADSVVLSLRESGLSGQDYDYFVELQLGLTAYDGNSPADVGIYLKDSGGLLGAKIVQAGTVTEFTMNSNTNQVQFENRDYENYRHIRASVDGTLNPATGAFTAVTLAKVIWGLEDNGDTSDNGDHTVLFGFDGTKEWADHYQDGTQVGGYPTCSAEPCTAIETTHARDFLDFAGNAITGYQNSTILDLSTFSMSF